MTPFRRDTRIRTWDPLLPKQVRYRAALHPEKNIFWSFFKEPGPGTLAPRAPCATRSAISRKSSR